MFAKKEGLRPIILCLVLIKIGYLTFTCVAAKLWADFDEDTFSAVRAKWFDASAHSLEDGGYGLSRHFTTWDAAHYLYLSEVGYSRGVKSCAFYPLWPLMIECFTVLTGGSHIIGGMVLANIFSLVAWTVFYQVVARRFEKAVALWALAFLIAFPGSLFYQFVYSEPLFFLLVTLLWFGLEHNRFGLAWIAALLLPLSRGVGIFSLLPIVWYWLMRRPCGWLEKWRWLDAERKRLRTDPAVNAEPWRGYILMAAPLLGLALVFFLMWIWTGNPLEGIEAQKYWRVHSISNLWNVPKFIVGWFSPSNVHAFRGSMLDRTMFLIVLCMLPVIWRLGKDLAVWTYVLGILPAMSGTFTSFTRFACCVFPMFIALAVFTHRHRWAWLKWGLLTGFGVLHLILLWRFVNFRWAG
jgi:mannosyltransferase PIG-V